MCSLKNHWITDDYKSNNDIGICSIHGKQLLDIEASVVDGTSFGDSINLEWVIPLGYFLFLKEISDICRIWIY